MGLWTPSTNKQINELTVKIEATRFEILQLQDRLDKENAKMRQVNGHLESIGEAINMIKGEEARIVSLSEYANLAGDDKRVYDIGIATSNNQQALLKEITAREKFVQEAKEEIAKIEKRYGHVLEFKRRG